MASDKRPILSGKRARSRRKRAALRACTRVDTSFTPECDSEGDAKRPQLPSGDSSDKTTSQSEDELVDDLVLVCRPTMPNFCSVFRPQDDEAAYSRLRQEVDYTTFRIQVSSFQETCDGFVTYTVQVTICDQPSHTFQLERRYSEFVTCAAAVNKQSASGVAATCCSNDETAALKDGDQFQWQLPAKTWFRVTQTNALEERRAQLEESLTTLLLQHNRRMCNLPVVRDFLMLDLFGVQVAEQKNLDAAAAHFEG